MSSVPLTVRAAKGGGGFSSQYSVTQNGIQHTWGNQLYNIALIHGLSGLLHLQSKNNMVFSSILRSSCIHHCQWAGSLIMLLNGSYQPQWGRREPSCVINDLVRFKLCLRPLWHSLTFIDWYTSSLKVTRELPFMMNFKIVITFSIFIILNIVFITTLLHHGHSSWSSFCLIFKLNFNSKVIIVIPLPAGRGSVQLSGGSVAWFWREKGSGTVVWRARSP